MADRGDFDAFVTSRYAALARTAMLLTGARASGEDLLQEALIRTYVAWPKVRELAAGEAYVRPTMVRLLIRDRKRRWSGEVPHGDLPEQAHGPDHRGDPRGDPATRVTVRDALRDLPIEQRAVLVLRFYADLTESQIAEALDCAPGTVKSRISRGLAALRAGGLALGDPVTDDTTAITTTAEARP